MIVLEDKRKAKAERSATRELSEGEQARQILEANGYVPRSRTAANGQYEFPCPFHEEPGAIGRGKATNFYLDKNTSKYYCQSASCGQKGNLLTLERFFGLDNDPNSAHQTLEQRLRDYELQLTQDRKDFLRKKQGLSEKTLERFRVGYDTEHGNYLIPYMEGRRPVAFRWYNPDGHGPKGSKYWWEPGTFATLFNSGDGVGDPSHGRVVITEGEWKTMLACQFGYASVSVPGAAQWKPEWSQTFNHAKEIIVCLDNDNAAAHRKDNECMKCKPPTATKGKDEWVCTGHNPGQDGAAKLMDVFGHRARNVVLPLSPGERKTDLNEYVIRDGASLDDVGQALLGLKSSPFLVRSLGQIYEEPPEEATFIVSDGILPVGGRLLVTGAPKGGKSIFIENLALSIASGVPFLRRFNINEGQGPSRVLLLDRELSARSLFDRLDQLIAERPGYALAADNLMIDHQHRIILDQPEAAGQLIGLVRANNVQVLMLDTAYKFFNGDVEKAASVIKAFATLDEVIKETGISVVLTHHHRKGNKGSKAAIDNMPSAEDVTGSLYWTGWPNGTVLLNFLDRRVDQPFNTVASFVAFRDAAPPEPLALMRDRTSISYKEIKPYAFGVDDEGKPIDPNAPGPAARRLNGKNLAQYLMECCPVLEDEFIPQAADEFGQKVNMIKIHLLDILDKHPDFERDGDGSRGAPYTWRFKYMPKEGEYKEVEDQPTLDLAESTA
jgi:hypothetical protein